MWWKNVKLMVLLVVVIVFLMYLFVGFACGLPGMVFQQRWFRRQVLTVLQGGQDAFARDYSFGGYCWRFVGRQLEEYNIIHQSSV